MTCGHPALDRLRHATAAAHEALDSTLDIVERLAAPGQRVAMLHRYHALHAAAEPPIVAWLDALPELDLARRCRAPTLAAALRDQGAEPVRPPPLRLGGRAEAFGALYVLEGSTLGGRMILRGLQARGVDLRGLGFLDPYGAAAGQAWRSLCTMLEAELATAPALAAACDGARATFRLAAVCLGRAPAKAA